MAGVTLKYPATGPTTASVELPFPEHNQAIKFNLNQHEYHAPNGTLWTVKAGPDIYQISRVFGMLSETESALAFAFLEACNFSANRILYCYVDGETGEVVEVPCRIIQAPTERAEFLNMRHLPLTFEQYTHPDSSTDVDEFAT